MASKVYLSVDVEGINRVSEEIQTLHSGGNEYKKTLHQLHLELNAILDALKNEGVEHITVNDAHNTMDNICPSLIPSNIKLLGGKPREISMMYGLDSSYDCIFFVGYHAKAGNKNGILAHTFNLKFKSVKLNNKLISEAQLNSIYAGQLGVPIAFASGDNFFCQEIKDDIGEITTVTTKYITKSNVISFRKNDELLLDLSDKTREAIKNPHNHITYDIEPPYTLEVDIGSENNISKFIYLMSVLPNAKMDGTKISFKSNIFREVYTFLQFLSANV